MDLPIVSSISNPEMHKFQKKLQRYGLLFVYVSEDLKSAVAPFFNSCKESGSFNNEDGIALKQAVKYQKISKLWSRLDSTQALILYEKSIKTIQELKKASSQFPKWCQDHPMVIKDEITTAWEQYSYKKLIGELETDLDKAKFMEAESIRWRDANQEIGRKAFQLYVKAAKAGKPEAIEWLKNGTHPITKIAAYFELEKIYKDQQNFDEANIYFNLAVSSYQEELKDDFAPDVIFKYFDIIENRVYEDTLKVLSRDDDFGKECIYELYKLYLKQDQNCSPKLKKIIFDSLIRLLKTMEFMDIKNNSEDGLQLCIINLLDAINLNSDKWNNDQNYRRLQHIYTGNELTFCWSLSTNTLFPNKYILSEKIAKFAPKEPSGFKVYCKSENWLEFRAMLVEAAEKKSP